MIELTNQELCWAQQGCPCLLYSSEQPHCALDYFNIHDAEEVWYNTDTGEITLERLEDSDEGLPAIQRPRKCIEAHNEEQEPFNLTADEKEKLIEALHTMWVFYLRFHPDDCWTDPDMVFYKDDPPETWPVVLIPICDVEDDQVIKVHSTGMCFTPEVDNGEPPVFSRKGVLEFLQAHRIEFIVGTVDRWNFDLDEQEGLPICTIAFKAEPSIGRAFAFFIGKFSSDLRMRHKNGWCFFESE